MTTSDYLNQLIEDRNDLVDNLETKGITGLTGDETFTELVPEVLNISSGVDINDYFLSSGNMNGYLSQSLILKFPYSINLEHRTDASNLFSGYRNLREVSIINGDSVTSLSYMFGNCISLQKIDIRDMILSRNPSGYTTMFGSSSSNRVPNNCLIIVKDQTEKTWINTNFSRFTNVQTASEYEGS